MALNRKKVMTKEEVEELHPLIQEIWSEVFTPIIGSEQVTYMLATYQSVETIFQEIQDGANYFLLLEGQNPVGYTAYSLIDPNLGLSYDKL